MSGRTDVEEAVKAADAALEHARNLPPGPDRSAAIKEAGKLRTAAESLKKHAIGSIRGRRPEAIRRTEGQGRKDRCLMPTSIAGKVAVWTYFIGYWFYLLVAAVVAWPRLPLMAWVNYVVFQAVCAVFWPILVALELLGFRW